MKAYETIEQIAIADPAELAERCRLGQAAAKAVRAAARLALEDRKTMRQKLPADKRTGMSIAATLAAEAAETPPESKQD
jgi:hypothetical protein